MSRKPSPKKLKFDTGYLAHGNATRAAKEAGYKEPNKQGPRLSKSARTESLLEAQHGVALSHALTDRAERRGFWAQTMRDPALDYQHRLRASELDAKSEGDFIERLEIKNANPYAGAHPATLDAAKKLVERAIASAPDGNPGGNGAGA